MVTSLLLSADLRIKQIRRKLPERGGSRSTITLSNVGGLKLNFASPPLRSLTTASADPGRRLFAESGPSSGDARSNLSKSEDWRSADIEILIRHQPARTVSTHVSRFARLPVCEQCAGKVEGNTVGTRSGRSPPVLPLPDRVRSQGVRIERRSRTRNAVQMRICAAFWKQWRKSVTTDSVGLQCPGT